MRRVLIFILLLTSFTIYAHSQSQRWLGFGYNMSRFKLDNSLNYVIDRYNQNRVGNITKEMEHVHFADGLTFSLGFNFNRFIMDASYTAKVQKVFAQGIYYNSPNKQERDVRFKSKTASLGFGFALFNSRPASLSLCASFDILTIRTETRGAEIEQIDETDYEIASDASNTGSTFYLNLLLGSPRGKGLALIIRPYYQLCYNETNFWDLNYKINPNTVATDRDYIGGKPSNFGLSLMLAIYGSN
jgi:hypothetical protein